MSNVEVQVSQIKYIKQWYIPICLIYAQGKRKSWKAKGNLIKLGPIINLVGVLGHWDKSQPSESSVDPHERVYTKKNLNYFNNNILNYELFKQ